MIKIKKNNSILKRILAFLGAGICALACMLIFGYNTNMTAYARDFDEYYSYSSMEYNVKISNSISFNKNLFPYETVSGTIYTKITLFEPLKVGTYTLSIIVNSSDTDVNRSAVTFQGKNDKFLVQSNFYRNTRYNNIITLFEDCYSINFYAGTSYNNSVGDTFTFYDIQLEVGEVATNYVPYQQNDFISFINTLNVGIEKNSSAWLLEQCVFNNLRTNNNNYYMKSSIEDSSLQNVIYYNSNNVKGNFMFKDFFKYKDNVIDENNYFRIFVNFDYIESSDYDSTTYFNGNVQKIIYGSHKNWDTYKSLQVSEKPSDWGTQYAKFNFISYVDNNGNNCNIYFPLISDNDNDYYGFRILFVNTNGLTDYSDGYNTGYMNGKNDGYASGEKAGYQNGYKKGKTDGYNSGYSYGVSESNDYTFLGLISACIDAPITYFTSLFNFELLGVNLSAFLTGLFTLCVIVTIVKLCLGGK